MVGVRGCCTEKGSQSLIRKGECAGQLLRCVRGWAWSAAAAPLLLLLPSKALGRVLCAGHPAQHPAGGANPALGCYATPGVPPGIDSSFGKDGRMGTVEREMGHAHTHGDPETQQPLNCFHAILMIA